MTSTMLSIFLVLLVLLLSTEAYPGGPPLGACEMMTPSSAALPNGHGASPQNSPAPYEVKLPACYKDGEAIEVEVKQTGSDGIKGLFVQGRGASGTSTVGTFTVTDPDLKTLACGGITNSAVSHNKILSASSYKMMWTPPSGNTGNVRIRVTVVRELSTFWTGIESTAISKCSSGTGSTISTALCTLIVSFVAALFVYRRM